MGGQLVALPVFLRRKGFAVQVDLKTNSSDFDPYAFDMHPSHFDIKLLPASFHLPEVCRQIYSEAALTAYHQNVFLFNGPLEERYGLFDCLMEVQREAIQSVEIGATHLFWTIRSYEFAEPMTDILPNLEHILVSARALEYTCCGMPTLRNKVIEEVQTVVMQRLREVYGDNIKIEFEK